MLEKYNISNIKSGLKDIKFILEQNKFIEKNRSIVIWYKNIIY